jgi:hypothetical protein
MDSIFENFNSTLKRLDDDYHSIEVFHYYNSHYSQTGGVYANIKKH